MGIRMMNLGGAAALMFGATLAAGVVAPAQAASMKECSLKYKAAKTAGTLNGEDWKAFRAAQCGSGAAAATPVPGAAAGTTVPVATAGAASATTASPAAPGKSAPARMTAAPTAGSGSAVFPSGINAKYTSDKPGKQRMETCLDQYHANKANGGNGGLKWIQKGGGYFSECTKKLKAV